MTMTTVETSLLNPSGNCLRVPLLALGVLALQACADHPDSGGAYSVSGTGESSLLGSEADAATSATEPAHDDTTAQHDPALPKSDRRQASSAGVPPEQARLLIDQLKAIYAPEAAAHGKELTFDMSDEALSTAHAHQGEAWGVTITAAFLADPTLNLEIMSAVLCHELGHVFGGFPFEYGTVAGEGQADYFAAKECLPRLWGDATEGGDRFNTLPKSVRADCDDVWSSAMERQRCYRIADVAAQFGAWLAGRADAAAPSLTTSDKSSVTITKTKDYPSLQCRVDTFLHGSLCTKRFESGVIPGAAEAGSGYTPESEQAAAPYSCTEGPGARPLCWFKPNARRFDCGSIDQGIGQCETRDGLSGVLTCNPDQGEAFFPCGEGTTCIPDADGLPTCTDPSQAAL